MLDPMAAAAAIVAQEAERLTGPPGPKGEPGDRGPVGDPGPMGDRAR